MARLNMIVEGHSEETFVNQVLVGYLAYRGVYISVRRVETSRRRGRIRRGGLINYDKAKNDAKRWMKEDQKEDAHFSTMFDLYALPKTFPGFVDAANIVDPIQRAETLEDALARDIPHVRFIPYIQVHEF